MNHDASPPYMRMSTPLPGSSRGATQLLSDLATAVARMDGRLTGEIYLLRCRVAELQEKQPICETMLSQNSAALVELKTATDLLPTADDCRSMQAKLLATITSLRTDARELAFQVDEDRRQRILNCILMSERMRRELRQLEAQAESPEWLADARRGDLEELEAAIAAFGLEKFHATEPLFDAAKQKAVPFPTQDYERFGEIKRRMHPGWRLHSGLVVQKETVVVWARAQEKEPE